MREMTTTKTKRTRLKLSGFLAEHGVRYKWVGTWPAIPMKRNSLEATTPRRVPTKVRMEVYKAPGTWVEHFQEVPPDAPPEWVDRIHERIFDTVLPLKKNMSIEYLDAALFGYIYAAVTRKLAGIGDSAPDTADGTLDEELRKNHTSTLNACRARVAEVLADWKVSEAGDYLKGFAYGIECHHREESWILSATTQALQIYKALLLHQHAVQDLTRKNATAKDIGELIAEQAVMSGRMTFAQYFEKNPNSEAKEVFLKTVQKIIERMGIPLPQRGRPRINSDTR
jgi:hypothetical protein